ncbi:MAG: hypothetical protein QXD23_01150 [Candidatus Micrarchaeaceae archaeon]
MLKTQSTQTKINFLHNTELQEGSIKDKKLIQKLEIALLQSVKDQTSRKIDIHDHLQKIIISNMDQNSAFWGYVGIKEKILVKKGIDFAKMIIEVFQNKKSPTIEQQECMPDLIKSAYIISDHVPVHIKQRILKSLPEEKREVLIPFINKGEVFSEVFRDKSNTKQKTLKKLEEKMTIEEVFTSFEETKFGNTFDNLKLYTTKKLKDKINNILSSENGKTLSSPNSFHQLFKKLIILKMNPYSGNKFTRGKYNNKNSIIFEKRKYDIFHAGSSNSFLRINYIVRDGFIHIIEIVKPAGRNSFETIISE